MDIINASIQKTLIEQYAYIQSYFKPEQIIGIFAYGSMNYGFYKEGISDVDSKVVILPTLHQALFEAPISKEFHYKDTHIEVKDIRLMNQMYLKQNINFVETLYTEYKIINPEHYLLFTRDFINHRDKIAHYNIRGAVKSIGGQLLHTIQQFENNPTDRKKLHNIIRLHTFLTKYLNNEPYLDCLQPKGETYNLLWNIKFNTDCVILPNDMNTVAKIKEEITELINNCNQYQDKQEEVEKFTQKSVETLIKLYWNGTNQI